MHFSSRHKIHGRVMSFKKDHFLYHRKFQSQKAWPISHINYLYINTPDSVFFAQKNNRFCMIVPHFSFPYPTYNKKDVQLAWLFSSIFRTILDWSLQFLWMKPSIWKLSMKKCIKSLNSSELCSTKKIIIFIENVHWVSCNFACLHLYSVHLMPL